MKKLFPTFILLLILFCIVFSTTAQTHSNYYSVFKNEKISATEMAKLPANRTAFIFLNSNSRYTNPAFALLNTNNNPFGILKTDKSSNIASVANDDNKTTTATSENICMFPNLTEDELWVKKNGQQTDENVNVEIYNEEGERVYYSKLDYNLHKINLCEFTAGTFLVKVDDAVQKLIIE